MIVPQFVVIALLLSWSAWINAAIVSAFVVVQIVMMARFLKSPIERALWYSGFGVPLFVFGMLASAFAVRAFADPIG
jgi:chlorophyll synthase